MCILLIQGHLSLESGLKEAVQSVSEVELLTEKYNSLSSLVEAILDDNKIKDSTINALTMTVEKIKDENRIKDNELKELQLNVEYLTNQDKLKESKIQKLENYMRIFENNPRKCVNATTHKSQDDQNLHTLAGHSFGISSTDRKDIHDGADVNRKHLATTVELPNVLHKSKIMKL